MIKAFS
jgi:Tfp pilus assembly protein PilN